MIFFSAKVKKANVSIFGVMKPSVAGAGLVRIFFFLSFLSIVCRKMERLPTLLSQ